MKSIDKQFRSFGEYLYWSYANLQMLHYAIKVGIEKYDRVCYMIRSKAFKAYIEGRWRIHDLFEINVEKVLHNNYCWYCGAEIMPTKLTIDHVFPQSKGGKNEFNNIIMVCKTCNSSKQDTDLFKWYTNVRKEFPPLNVLIHYLKNIYIFSLDNNLMTRSCEELDTLELPFDWHYIPISYPQPIHFLKEKTN